MWERESGWERDSELKVYVCVCVRERESGWKRDSEMRVSVWERERVDERESGWERDSELMSVWEREWGEQEKELQAELFSILLF